MFHSNVLESSAVGGCASAHAPPPSGFARIKLIAHRGAHSAHVAENSYEAVQKAFYRQLGAEVDVRATSDGELVLWHDADLGRLIGEQRPLSCLTYRQLHRLAMHKADTRIARLADVLDDFPELPLLLDLKEPKRMKQVIDMLDAHPWAREHAMVLAWGAAALAAIQRLSAEVRTCLAVSNVVQLEQIMPSLETAHSAGKAAELSSSDEDVLSLPCQAVSLHLSVLNVALARKLKRGGYAVFSWRVRAHEELIACRNAGALPISDLLSG